MTNENDSPRVLGLAAKRMAPTWTMISDILGGTPRMRRARHRWLPQEPKESSAAYECRLERSVFFGAYKRACKLLSSIPFSKPVQLSAKLSSRLKAFLDDADGEGSHIDLVANRLLYSAIAFGQCHLLCDLPPKPQDEISIADAAKNARRPGFALIEPQQLLGFRYETQNGRRVLVQVRILESVRQAEGLFGEAEVPQVRVLYVDHYELWRPTKSAAGVESWQLFADGPMTLGKIPMVTLTCGEPLGYLEAAPPLIDLAWENIKWWQSSSDQANILHVARVPMWFGRGFPSKDEAGNPIVWTFGPNSFIVSADPNSDMKCVETSGGAIGAGRQDLLDCEARMALLGIEPLVRRESAASATEELLNFQSAYADLFQMTRGCEDTLSAGIQLMAEWSGESIASGPERLISLNRDFGLSAADASDLAALISLRQSREITQATLLNEFKRRSKLDPSLDVATEIARTMLEAPRFDGGVEPDEPTPSTKEPVN